MKFSKIELTFLITNSIIFKLFSLYPTIIETYAATGLWVVCLIAFFVSLAVFGLISIIPLNKGDMPLILRWTVAIYLILQMTIYLRHTADSLKVTSFYDMPTLLIFLLILLPAIYAAFKGIKGVVRLNSIILPIVILCNIVVCLGAISKFQIANLFPMFGYSVGSTIITGLKHTAFFADIFILFLLAPYSEQRKIGFSAILLSGLTMLIVMTSYQMLASYPTTIFHTNPLQLMQNISQYDINFIRISVSFLIFWVASFMLAISTSLWLAMKLLHAPRWTVFILGGIILTLSLFLPDILTAPRLYEGIIYSALTVLATVLLFRKKLRQKEI